ncbi:hypothetical protein QBC41DRAFT_335515 [Cercophora samala]|uniref:Uncharacterized protein n=1 Tax=Cercophora samala TaxID=330535 RepID=A0AA39ZH81_9PEZI|nr:hypothetical protein QBC41DRAFT_335515 [Cercophora samala]
MKPDRTDYQPQTPRNQPTSQPTTVRSRTEPNKWVQIEDGKYLHLPTRELRDRKGMIISGPPIRVGWETRSNRYDHHAKPPDTLSGLCEITMTEYLTKVGDFFKKGDCMVDAVRVSHKYGVGLAVTTWHTYEEFRGILERNGLVDFVKDE